MKKTLTASLMALMMTASLCACGSDDDPAKSVPADTVSVTEQTTTETTTTTEQTTTEKTTTKKTTAEKSTTAKTTTARTEKSGKTTTAKKKDSAEYGKKPSANDELATVQYLADTYLKAIEKRDYEKLTEIVDVELMYYLANGKTGTHKEYLNEVRSSCSSSGTGESEIGKPKKDPDTAKLFNSYLQKMDQNNGGQSNLAKTFKVESAYSVSIKTKTTSTSADAEVNGKKVKVNGSFSSTSTHEMPIIKINGEWKCDAGALMMMALMDEFF